MTHFATTLLRVRKSVGATHEQIDSRVWKPGCRYVRDLERGRRSPSPHLAGRIARAMGVPPWRLLAPLIEDAQDAMCTRAERTMAVVGITAFALSLSEPEWVELRRDPAKLAAAVEAWRDGNA